MDTELHILLVEDLPTDAELIERELRRAALNFSLRRVDTRESFLTVLKEFKPDLILSDYSMPTFDGLSALRLAEELAPGVPFIIVTGSINEEVAVECMKAGAIDYVLKERLARLGPTIQRALEKKRAKEEKERAEQALQESEERYRQMFMNNQAVKLLLDAATGAIVDVNPAAAEFYGYSLAELKRMNIAEIDTLPPEQLAQRLAQAASAPRTYSNFRHRLASGRMRDVEVFTGPVLVRGRTLLYSIINDITERKQAEEALRAAEARYRDLFENANDIIYTHDLLGNFTSINKAAERLTGYARAEIIGTNITQLVAPEYQPHVREIMANTLKDKTSEATYELELVCKHGARLPVEAHTRLIYEGEQPAGVQGIARDTSERKHAEAVRRSLEEQLFQSQKMESIGTLAGGVAHDFNNLLTAILGNTQLARARLEPDAPLYQRLVEIEKAANRATLLTGQLLAFSRRQQLERKVIDPNETLSNFGRMLRRIIGEDIELHVKTAPNLPPIFADSVQIEQVIMNLAVNARDAMPEGGQLTIETHQVQLDEAFCQQHPWAKPGQYVQFVVSDTGAGMDQEVQKRIFEPFFTTKKVGKGTGLGLAVVYGIVKQHDGLIHVYSEVGQGTTFKIYLPAARRAVAAEDRATEPELRGGTETILLAEDEEVLRKLGEEVLVGLGYTVLLAADGLEAIELYQAHRDEVALVMLDVVMPHLGGRETYERIRASGSQVPVIFMTGYSAEMTRSTFIAETGATLLQKPYTVDALGRKVAEALERARRGQKSGVRSPQSSS
jgi:PAS domain S-box-containing protein